MALLSDNLTTYRVMRRIPARASYVSRLLPLDFMGVQVPLTGDGTESTRERAGALGVSAQAITRSFAMFKKFMLALALLMPVSVGLTACEAPEMDEMEVGDD